MTLAERLDAIEKKIDPCGYVDSGLSVEYFEKLISIDPQLIINNLLCQMEVLIQVIEQQKAKEDDLK